MEAHRGGVLCASVSPYIGHNCRDSLKGNTTSELHRVLTFRAYDGQHGVFDFTLIDGWWKFDWLSLWNGETDLCSLSVVYMRWVIVVSDCWCFCLKIASDLLGSLCHDFHGPACERRLRCCFFDQFRDFDPTVKIVNCFWLEKKLIVEDCNNLWLWKWQDTRRKFIWEEMSYLERWWKDASESKKRGLVNLVKNGQLEIVGGGWVMNDEVTYMKPNCCMILELLEKKDCLILDLWYMNLEENNSSMSLNQLSVLNICALSFWNPSR